MTQVITGPYTEGGGAAGAVAAPLEKIKLAIFILL